MSIVRQAIVVALTLLLAGCGDPAPIAALPAEPAVVDANGIQRLDIRFPCGNTECAGWLFVPASRSPAPVVVMAHGFAGTRDVALPYFATEFARSGIAAFVFDYRHFGASGGAPRQLVDPWQQLDDWKAAIQFVRANAQVDGSHLALWGTSMGGGLALAAAAADGHVDATVAQAPMVDTTVEGEATFPGYIWVTRLLLAGWGDLIASLFSDDPSMIPAIAPSDGFGMIVDDKAFAAFKSLVHSGTRYRNQVAARSIFTFDDYNPAVLAADIKAPVLLIASRGDRFAPFSAVKAFADRHPNARLEEVGGDHFDIYAEPQAHRAATLAAEFLRRHLLTGEPRTARPDSQ
ncbi:MAG: alpha/beta fold hydrolase [Alphaproteobacteria bacterium]|nr:alpha/beta fold hydrolase [Alphaproteobacteria bacterium]